MQPAMRYMAGEMLHDENLAADAVQDTFARLWCKRWRLGLMPALEAKRFCMAALRNQCVDMLRKQKHIQRLDPRQIEVADTSEAVYEGAYNESVFRSAPYFALDIDGITILE